jgi:hypothetical protein
VNINEIDDALSAALHSLAAAQAVLRKSLPGRSIDVLSTLDDPEKFVTARQRVDGRAAPDRALAALADAERRVVQLEASRDLDAQHAPRKTASR